MAGGYGKLIQLKCYAEHQDVAFEQVCNFKFVYPAELNRNLGLVDFCDVKHDRSDPPGTAFEPMQDIGHRTLVVLDLREVRADRTQSVEHCPACVLGRLVLAVNVEADKVVELQAPPFHR